MDDEDTEVGPPPKPDTDRGLMSVMLADTDEWDDTDREMFAQGTIDTTPQMFEDTGVVILDKPAVPGTSDKLSVTFRERSVVTFREPTNQNAPAAATAPRASTAGGWPPAPREPGPVAPKHAGIYAAVARPETKN